MVVSRENLIGNPAVKGAVKLDILAKIRAIIPDYRYTKIDIDDVDDKKNDSKNTKK